MKYQRRFFTRAAYTNLMGHWCAWACIYGYGLCISNEPPHFTERYGFDRWQGFRVLGIRVSILKP